MPVGYPGYVSICPNGIPSLLSPWVAVIGSFAYGLWIETALLVLGTLWLKRRNALPYGGAFSVGAVATTALVASVADALTAQRNHDACRFLFFGDQHWRPEPMAAIMHAQAIATAQANVAFEIAALMFLIGTFAATRVGLLGWRGRR